MNLPSRFSTPWLLAMPLILPIVIWGLVLFLVWEMIMQGWHGMRPSRRRV